MVNRVTSLRQVRRGEPRLASQTRAFAANGGGLSARCE